MLLVLRPVLVWWVIGPNDTTSKSKVTVMLAVHKNNAYAIVLGILLNFIFTLN